MRRCGEFNIGVITGLVEVGKTTVGGAALVQKGQREGPVVARVVDERKRGGGGAEANGGPVKGSDRNGRKRRSERSATKL